MKRIGIITNDELEWNKMSANIVADIYKTQGFIVPIREFNRRSIVLSDDTKIRWIRPSSLECELCGERLDEVYIVENCKLSKEELFHIQVCLASATM
jgi:hypothetical protein